MGCHAAAPHWIVAASAAFLLGVPPTYAQVGERVQVETDEGLAPYADALRAICSSGVSEAEALGLQLPDTITVRAKRKATFPSFCLAQGNDIRFEVCSDGDLGPYWVAEFWHIRFYKVRDLLAAVLDVATRGRYPALTEMIAATELVPKLYGLQGLKVWPQPYDYNTVEGYDSYTKELWDADLVERCPGLDLAVAGRLVADNYGLEALCAALQQACTQEVAEGGEIPALAQALVEVTGDETLRERLAHTADLCQAPPPGEDVVIYDFEAAADARFWHSWHSDVERVADGPEGAGGALRWTKTGADDSWPTLLHQAPYWRYRDWRGFTALEMDLLNDSDGAQKLAVELYDRRRRVNGLASAEFTLAPHGRRHISVPLRRLRARAAPGSELFDGTFHYGDVQGISLLLWPAAGPVTIYVDNLALRAEAGP